MCEDTQLLLKRTLYRARKLMQLRQEDESVKEFIRAMALARIVHGDTHWRYARAQIFLAHVYLDMKSYYIQADDHASEALCNLYNNFCMEELPQKKTQVLFTLFLGNLVRGEANTHLRNYSQAEKCLQEAAKYLEDWDESLRNVPRRCADMEDFQKWRIRMNLSLARLWRKKKPALMMQHYHNALEDTRERYKGRGHKVILILQEIGEAIVETCPREQIADSIIYLEEAVHVAKESYDEDSVEVARSRHILVRACMNLDEPQELLLLATLERVERIFKEQLGLQHPDTLRVLKDIVEILLSLEDFEEILPRLQLLVKYENVVFKEVAEETRDTLKKLARVYMKMDQPDEAVRCLQRCVNTDTLLFGANDKKTKATQRSLDLLLRNSRSLAALDNMEQKRRGSAQ